MKNSNNVALPLPVSWRRRTDSAIKGIKETKLSMATIRPANPIRYGPVWNMAVKP